MKKQRLWIMLLILSFFLLFNIAKADSILEFLDYAENNQNNSFWYSADDRLVIKNISNSYVDVESPIIKYWSTDINTYLFNISEEWKANSNPVAFRCIYDINNDSNISINWNKFRIELDMNSSNLNKSKTYYVYATPIDNLLGWNNSNWSCSADQASEFLKDGIAWKWSTTNGEDPCFNINANVYGEWSYCEDHSWNRGSSNDWNTSIYSINNVSHICDGNGDVTLRWQSFADVDVEIYLRSDSKETFERLWNVNSENKSYKFTPKDKDGHFSVRFEPIDWTQKINYDWHCLTTDEPEVKPVTTTVKPVVVWPKENIMLIVFGTLVLYIIYRIAKRKA